MKRKFNWILGLSFGILFAACSSHPDGYMIADRDDHPYYFTGPTSLSYLGGLSTLENNGNKVLETGETTSPHLELNVIMKPTCRNDIDFIWTTCLMERVVTTQTYTDELTLDENGQAVCATFNTHFFCVDSTLIQGSTYCHSGDYCSFLMTPGAQPLDCGWKITDAAAYDSDGTLLEGLSSEKLKEFGYELLPIQAESPPN